MPTLSQQRAKHALQKALDSVKQSQQGKFEPLCAGAGPTIVQNGLGQAMAFWASKRDDVPKQLLFEAIRTWLANRDLVKSSNVPSFFDAISRLEPRKYLAAQRETLLFLEWLKRFAAARLG